MLMRGYVSKIKASECIYLSSLYLYVFVNLFQMTYLYNEMVANGGMGTSILQLLRYIAYSLCMVKIFYGLNERVDKYVLISILFLLAIIASMIGANKAIFFWVLYIYGAQDIEFNKILKLFLSLQIIIFVFCIISYLCGIGAESILEGGRERYFLGFGWVNRAPYLWLFMFWEYFCLKKGRIDLVKCFWFIGGVVWFYLKTRTRFPFLISLATLMFVLIYNVYLKSRVVIKISDISKNITCTIFRCMIWGCAFIGIMSAVIYTKENAFLETVNRMLSSRLSLGHEAIQKYGLNLFGNKTVWTGSSTLLWGLSGSSKYQYVDCGYLQLALDYGLLILIAVLIIYDLAIFVAYKKKEHWAKYCILFVGVISIVEPRLLDFAVNPFILYTFCNARYIGKVRKIKEG